MYAYNFVGAINMYRPKFKKAAERLHNWNMTFLSIFGALAYYYYRTGRYSFIVLPGTERYEMLMQMQTILNVVLLLLGVYIVVRVGEVTIIAKREGKDPWEVWWRQFKARLKLF